MASAQSCQNFTMLCLASLFLSLLLATNNSEAFSLFRSRTSSNSISSPSSAQPEFPSITFRQWRHLTWLRFLADLSPRFQRRLEAYERSLGLFPTAPPQFETTTAPPPPPPTTTTTTVTPTTAAASFTSGAPSDAPNNTTPAAGTGSGNATSTTDAFVSREEMEEETEGEDTGTAASSPTASPTSQTTASATNSGAMPSDGTTAASTSSASTTPPTWGPISAEEMEEEGEEVMNLPFQNRIQCSLMEGVCMRKCETPSDVIRGVSCGTDANGQALVCCDD